MQNAGKNAMQLRLGFGEGADPLTIDLILSGLMVLVETPPERMNDAHATLSAVLRGVDHHPSGGLVFPISSLRGLANLPDHVSVRCDEALAPLWELVGNPPSDGLPANLDIDTTGMLVLRWRSEAGLHLADVPESSAAALLASDVPFVAQHASWERLKSSTRLPVRAGVARVNIDGFIEVVSSKPQMVEASPLPGLFRLDDTHFGVALAYVDAVRSAAGFDWSGPLPVIEEAPSRPPDLPVSLSSHALTDLRSLTEQLAATRAAVVVWDPRLGRRILTLAAIAALDAWPALVVTDPAHVWVWRRHAALLGLSAGLAGDEDMRIITYHDLAAGSPFGDPSAVVFDDPVVGEGASPESRRACHRLDRVLDAYRVAVCSSWPDDDPTEQVAVLSLLRPVEFRDDVPLAWRYPLRPDERAAEHVGAYLTRRRADDPGRDPTEFRRSTAVVVDTSDPVRDAVERITASLAAGEIEPEDALAQVIETTTAGTESVTSPKLATTLSAVTEALAHQRRVAVLTRSSRFASTLATMVGRARCAVVDEREARFPRDLPQCVVVRFDTSLPPLTAFDEVVVCDYPWSLATLDRAVGAPSGPGPASVCVVHLRGSIDDRLAMFASLQGDDDFGDADPPDGDEAAWLLLPR